MTDRKHPLVAFREANKLSQDAAAALVGISQVMWSKLETGQAYARPSVAKRISDLTGMSMDLLLNFTDNDSAPEAAPESPAPSVITKDMP